MAGDWIRLHRSLLDSEQMSDPWLCQLFIWCLLRANYVTGNFRGQIVQPGQFVVGRIAAAEELRVSPSKWYRGIQRLIEMNCVTTETNNHWTTITLCNWKTYQSFSEKSEQPVTQPANNQRTTDDTTTEQPADTIEERKKERREEEKETLPAKRFEPETRNKRHPMAEYLPTPDAAIHGIEDADGFVMYQDDPERWERALIRWWNERPGVVLWPHDGLDDHARRLLYERMLDPKWTWKRTIGEFPLHFPSDWKASLDWFLEVGNVTKIIGKRFKATKPKGGQNGKTRDNTGATFSGTPDGGVGWGDGAANSQTGVF